MNILSPILNAVTVLTEDRANAVASVNNQNADEGDVYKVAAHEHGFAVSLYDAEGYVGTL